MSGGHGLSEQMLGDLQAAFNLFDANKDGSIDAAELGRMMKALGGGEDVSDREVRDMITEVDMSGTGTVEFNEFLFMMAKRIKDPESNDDARKAFSVFDTDKSGFIDGPKLRAGLKRLGEDLSESEVAQIIKDADKDGDGKLSFEDFSAMMS